MYIWKCWRDTRAHFILYLTLLLTLCIFSAAATALVWHPRAGWSLLRGGSAARIGEIWQKTVLVALILWGAGFTAIASISLGASGIGEEFRRGTLEFLLTRPRPRRYFAWTSWAVGLCELLAMLSLAVLATFGVLVYLTGYVYTWRFLGMGLFLGTAGAVLYGLTYFMTVLTRSGRDGLAYSVMLFLVHILLGEALPHYWPQVKLPALFDLPGAIRWSIGATDPFPAARLTGWVVVAVAFPVAAQLILDRAEV